MKIQGMQIKEMRNNTKYIKIYACLASAERILAYALFGIHMLLLAQLLELLRPLFIAATEAIESGLSEVTPVRWVNMGEPNYIGR
jgi:hypothetical protein